MNALPLFATSPRGAERHLEAELREIGAQQTRRITSGVHFSGSLETAYRACLWMRTANRILLPLLEFQARDPETLYNGIQQIDWSEHLHAEGSLAVDLFSSRSRIDHTHYGALKVKDAVVDQFRNKTGLRPSVDLIRPDIRINVHLLKNWATVSLDLSGESLHKRGYRTEGGTAPLKENLAAAILLQSGWKETAAGGGGLMDPMCGSGTLPIEAALIAADSAPGLLRDHFGFFRWKQHHPEIWNSLLEEAEEREAQGLADLPPIIGYDVDAEAIRISLTNLEKAGLSGLIHFEKRSLSDFKPHPRTQDRKGLVLLNPPYGERIGQQRELQPLYRQLGDILSSEFQGWQAALFTGNQTLGASVRIKPQQTHAFFNGAIQCQLLDFGYINASDSGHQASGVSPKRPQGQGSGGGDIEGFSNRLKKNLKRLKQWRQSEQIECYRVYDHDLPDFAVAIDVYGNHVHVQEYRAPATVDPEKASARLQAVLDTLPEVLGVSAAHISHKIRQRQKGRSQYERLRSENHFFGVRERKCRFLVNLTDYLDTGLFLDHRLTRQRIGEMAAGKRFLNLFAYTGTATVHAALGGAVTTTSVDNSRTYLDWARRNLALNGIKGAQHEIVRSDCMEWLKQGPRKYDLIFLDPPTFSNNRSTGAIFDVQRDHLELIRLIRNALSEDGILIFSNNFRNFKLDPQISEFCHVRDISRDTLSPDFQRRPNIHHCWLLTYR